MAGPTRAASYLAAAAAAALVAAVLATGPAGAGPAAARQDVVVRLRSTPAAVTGTAADHAARYGARVSRVYRHAITGYAASVPVASIDALRRDPSVVAVEADTVVRAWGSQTNAPWNLDRIDQRLRPLNGTYNWTSSGTGVTAYVVDTGIYFAHTQFGGRAVSGYDAVDGGSADDCNGHGTHIAGTVGGSTYGVAKTVRLVAVRVLNCQGSGTTSQIVAGLDWIVANHAAGAPAVANMSLGGSANTTMDAAVRRVITDGVSVSVAAGGSASDACNFSPARVTEAMTTGATDMSDRASSSTNTGTCVDWYAPGVSIPSAWIGGTTATATLSGSSMSAAHTTGVAAQYLQGHQAASPATVQSAIRSATTKDIVQPTTLPNNDLLFTNF
jgi:subtilisin family serine protease